MKLSDITESFMSQKLREALPGNYLNRPFVHTSLPYFGASGFSSDARNSGNTFLPSGVPHKPRNRRFLGLSDRMAIVL